MTLIKSERVRWSIKDTNGKSLKRYWLDLATSLI